MSSHVDQLFAAVSVLAGHGEIKKRLIAAYEKNLAKIEEDDLPIEARKPFADLRRKLSAVAPLNGEGCIRATVRKMSIIEADRCAHLIVDIYGLMIRHGDESGDELPFEFERKDAIRIPPFLVKSG